MTSFDFLVIGAGISGASAAAELSASGTVLLAETEALAGYHSTGRSAALYTPNFGSPLVRKLNAAGHAFFSAPPDGFSATPLLTPRAALTIARPGEEAALDAVLAMSTPAHPIHRIPVAEALRLAPVLRPEVVGVAALEPGVTDMDVAAIHQGFLGLFRRRGGTIRLNAPVTALSREGRGWRASVGGETVLAGIIVNAAGAWADSLAARCGVSPLGLTPMRRTVVLGAAVARDDFERWPILKDVRERYYFRPYHSALLVTPADAHPSPACDPAPDSADVARAVLRFETICDHRLTRIERRWAGLRTFAPDQAPVVGWSTEVEGYFWLAGLGAFSKAQEEGGKVFEALVKEGMTIQRKTQAVAEEKITEATNRMTHMASDIGSKAQGQWDKLENIFEERVAKALGKLGVPSARDIEALHARIEALTTAAGKSASAKTTAKPAAKTAAIAKPAAPLATKAAPRKAAAKPAATSAKPVAKTTVKASAKASIKASTRAPAKSSSTAKAVPAKASAKPTAAAKKPAPTKAPVKTVVVKPSAPRSKTAAAAKSGAKPTAARGGAAAKPAAKRAPGRK